MGALDYYVAVVSLLKKYFPNANIYPMYLTGYNDVIAPKFAQIMVVLTGECLRVTLSESDIEPYGPRVHIDSRRGTDGYSSVDAFEKHLQSIASSEITGTFSPTFKILPDLIDIADRLFNVTNGVLDTFDARHFCKVSGNTSATDYIYFCSNALHITQVMVFEGVTPVNGREHPVTMYLGYSLYDDDAHSRVWQIFYGFDDALDSGYVIEVEEDDICSLDDEEILVDIFERIQVSFEDYRIDVAEGL